ncbi:hypothetical protein ES703_125793 [subsurface metagenome]
MKKYFVGIIIIISISSSVFSQGSEKETKDPHMNMGHFSWAHGFGFTVPLGDVGEIMEMGYTLTARFNYNPRIPGNSRG